MARWQVPMGLRLKRTRFSMEGADEGEGEDFHSYAATLFSADKRVCVYASLFHISKAANVISGSRRRKAGIGEEDGSQCETITETRFCHIMVLGSPTTRHSAFLCLVLFCDSVAM